MPKITLGLYTGNTTPDTYGPNLIRMVLDLQRHDALCEDLPFIHTSSCRVDSNRNAIIYHFLQNKEATHLFIVDSDMEHPPEMPRLLASRDRPIISGAYFHRNMNGSRAPQSYNLVGESEDSRPGYGKDRNNFYTPMISEAVEFYNKFPVPETNSPLIITNSDGSLAKTSVYEMAASGFGCLLLSREALEQLSPPYLQDELGLNGDLAFFKKCASSGVKSFVDFSMICSHKGVVDIGVGEFARFLQETVNGRDTL